MHSLKVISIFRKFHTRNSIYLMLNCIMKFSILLLASVCVAKCKCSNDVMCDHFNSDSKYIGSCGA